MIMIIVLAMMIIEFMMVFIVYDDPDDDHLCRVSDEDSPMRIDILTARA